MMTRFARLRRSEEGFTLIELLVVVAIIALLATFAVPKLFEAINKSKKAPGQADMQTISAALERYYMDESEYPVGANAAAIRGVMATGYLKSGTTYKNGYSNGYIYVSDADGAFYVLVDPMNTDPADPITLTCNGIDVALDVVEDDLSVLQTATIDAADVAAGCTAEDPDGNAVPVVTN